MIDLNENQGKRLDQIQSSEKITIIVIAILLAIGILFLISKEEQLPNQPKEKEKKEERIKISSYQTELIDGELKQYHTVYTKYRNGKYEMWKTEKIYINE